MSCWWDFLNQEAAVASAAACVLQRAEARAVGGGGEPWASAVSVGGAFSTVPPHPLPLEAKSAGPFQRRS